MISCLLAEDADPSTFVISAAAMESLSPEDQAAAAEGMVSWRRRRRNSIWGVLPVLEI